jgi:serine/threonine-protein kinase
MNGAGSPYYMSPEQVRKEPGDRRADVFSLGVVLYELLTDTKPFDGDSLQAITQAVLEHEPPLASKVDKSVPKALAEIAARAMAKDPEHRFRSARSFARELRQWLDANPMAAEGEAMGATVPGAAIPSPRRRAAPWIVAASLAFIGIAATAVWWQSRFAAPAAATAMAPALKPAAEVRPPAAPVAAAPAPAVVMPSTESATPSQAPTPSSTSTSTAAPTSTLTSTPPQASTPPALPTGANNPAAQEALLLASIVPMSPLAGGRAPDPVKGTLASGEPAPAATAHRPEAAATTSPTSAALAKESAKERKAREAKEREARERDRLAAATPAVAATGMVRIAISPWGNVEIDGAASGAAPPLTEMKLAEGRHQIVVRNGDFAPFVATINVVAGQTTSIRHKFGSGG